MSKMSELWVCFPCCVTEQPQPVWRDWYIRSMSGPRYCIPTHAVLLIILQRRRRIDRSMIGTPTDFKVSTLLSSYFLLIHLIYSLTNELWLYSQHTGHIGSGEMASGSDVSWLKTLHIFLIEVLFFSFDIDSRSVPFKSFIYVWQLTEKWTWRLIVCVVAITIDHSRTSSQISSCDLSHLVCPIVLAPIFKELFIRWRNNHMAEMSAIFVLAWFNSRANAVERWLPGNQCTAKLYSSRYSCGRRKLNRAYNTVERNSKLKISLSTLLI